VRFPAGGAVSCFLALAVAALGGCSSSSDSGAESSGSVSSLVVAAGEKPQTGRLRVVTTVSPITSLVSAVAGDLVDIDGVVPEGTNSHTFEPSPNVAAVLSKADVVFMNGLQLEEPTKVLAEANKKAGADIIELGSNAIKENEYIYDFSFPKDGGKPNPHLWTNPILAKQYAGQVLADLSKRLPESADSFAANYALLAEKLDVLTEAMKVATATVPAEQRKLLTYHDSFPYFARDFGWKVIGAIQPSEFDEPTPRDVARLIDQIKTEKVVAIFGSEVFPSPVLEQIGKESGATYVDTLRDDDLPGQPGDPDHSYLGLMRNDFVTMIGALGGDAEPLKALDLSLPTPDKATYAQ
jgi:ABC-type Zn uptake system ZnuABC Zn-binding protein ZnuA